MPQEEALTKAQKIILKREGFIKSEIEAFSNARAPDGTLQDFAFNSKTFLAARKSRRKYVADLKEQGWTKPEIDRKIRQYYGLKAGRTPYDFLKLSYSPPRLITDFMDAVRRKIRARVTRTLGKGYGRILRPSVRPKFLPKRPRYPTRPT